MASHGPVCFMESKLSSTAVTKPQAGGAGPGGGRVPGMGTGDVASGACMLSI